MNQLQSGKDSTPQPSPDHDYLQTTKPKHADVSVQTSMTMDDISALEQVEIPKLRQPGEDVVSFATETDERVNFYTGVPSKAILKGLFFCVCFVLFFSYSSLK